MTHRDSYEKIGELEEEKKDIERDINKLRDEQILIEKTDKLCRSPFFGRNILQKLEVAKLAAQKARYTFVEAEKAKKKADKDFKEAQKIATFCEQNAEHKSNWKSWVTLKKFSQAKKLQRKESKLEKLKERIDKLRKTIPNDEWETMYTQDLHEAQGAPLSPAHKHKKRSWTFGTLLGY